MLFQLYLLTVPYISKTTTQKYVCSDDRRLVFNLRKTMSQLIEYWQIQRKDFQTIR